MNHAQIKIPYLALRDLIMDGTFTRHQMWDYVFKIYRKKEFSFPENYAEFTPENLRAFAKYVYSGDASDNQFFTLVTELCQMDQATINALDTDHILSIIALFDYLKEPYATSESLLERIGMLRGPVNKLKNYSIEQLSYADSYALAYNSDQNDKHLDLFFRSAYRPVGIPWSKKLLSHPWLYGGVSRNTKLTALMNYMGLRADLVQTHPVTFEGGSENTGMEAFGWTATILNLAGEKFGSYHHAKKTSVPMAFALFEMNGIQIKRMEEKSKK